MQWACLSWNCYYCVVYVRLSGIIDVVSVCDCQVLLLVLCESGCQRLLLVFSFIMVVELHLGFQDIAFLPS